MLDANVRSEMPTYAGAEHAPGTAPVARDAALRILIADDHEMIRVAMRSALAGLAGHIEWHEASCARGVETLLDVGQDFDLALLDFTMPGAGNINWVAALRARHPSVPLAVISAQEEPALIRKLIALGVAAYIPKSDPARVVLHAVSLVLAGGTYAPLRLLQSGSAEQARALSLSDLTARQREVLRCLARGLPNKLIARELQLSEGTVKAHLLAIYRALEVRNRTEAVIAAQRWRCERAN